MRFGLDYLGGNKYIDRIIRDHPKSWAAGFFMTAFGDAFDNIKKFVRAVNPPEIRVHGIWKDRHDYSESDIPEAARQAKRLALLQQEVSTVIKYSPCCEHRMDAQLVVKFYDAVASATSHAMRYVNTPLKDGAAINYALNEFHGLDNPRQALFDYSFDGTPCVDANVSQIKAIFEKAETFYFWDARFNGRFEASDTTPISQRHGWPDSKLINSIIYLHNDQARTSLPEHWVYKSHSENKGSSDTRAEKPVFICPVKTSEIVLKVSSGAKVGSFRYYGTYNDRRYRYYSSAWGYEIGRKAAQLQDGNRSCEVVIAGKTVGHVDPGFRAGDFR